MPRALALTVALPTAVLLASCAGAQISSPDIADRPESQNAIAALPAGIDVDLYQTRTDLPARRIEIAITNASGSDLTVTAAEFRSTQFAAPAVWAARPGGTVVRAGTGVDLPVPLAEPACEDPHPSGSIRIAFYTADGRAGIAEVPAVDRYGRLPEMRAEECFAASISRIAELTIDAPVRVDDSGASPIAFVALRIAPTGEPESFTIDAVEDTVLLALADDHGMATETLPVGLVVSGTDETQVYEIPIMPGRCDPHAIAEDKQGTVFILEATAPDGTSTRMRIAASTATRASIYDYIAQACDLPR